MCPSEVERSHASRPGENAAGVVHDMGPPAGPAVNRLPILAALAGAAVLGYLASGCLSAAVAWLSRLDRTTRNTLLVVAAVGGIPGAWWAYIAWKRGRARRAAENVASQPDGAAALAKLRESAIKQRLLASPSDAAVLAARLAETQHAGLTIRVCRPEESSRVVPFDAPFEPLPLDESDRNVQAMLAAESLSEANTAEARRTLEPGRQGARDRIDRAAARVDSLWLVGAVVAVGVCASIAFSLRGTRSPTATLMNLVVPSGVIAVMLGVRWCAKRRKRALLVVPGGFLHFGKWGDHGRSDLVPYLFARTDCVLIAMRDSERPRWIITVADARFGASFSATSAELRFLLRAWTSPVPPPTEEMIAGMVE